MASSPSESRPVSASASTSPARRRSVSRIARWRIISSATTVTACWRIRRSKSPRPPVSRAATSHACGAPRPLSETGRTSERPAISGWSGANSAFSAALPDPFESSSLRRTTSSRTCSSASSGTWRLNAFAEIVSPRLESTQTAPPVAAASARTTSSRPLSSSTSRSSRLWIAMPRWSTSYCSFTSRVKAFSVSAMNGSSYGHLEHREARASAPPRRAPPAASSWSKPVPKPSPARWRPDSSRTNSRCRFAVSSWIPVVSSSSPPDSQGVGSGSSEMCTQRTGASAPSSPVASSSPISDTSPRTVSI